SEVGPTWPDGIPAVGLPISGVRPFGDSGGPRGDPPGPVVLPSCLHREPDGGRLRWRLPDRRRPEPFRRGADVRGRQDVARPDRRYLLRCDPGTSPLPPLRPRCVVLLVVLRFLGSGVRLLRGPRLGRSPRRPGRRVRETEDASPPGREGVGPRPVRLRRRRAGPESCSSVVVRPAILLRGRAPRTARHHRYYARPASGREPRRLSDGEEA